MDFSERAAEIETKGEFIGLLLALSDSVGAEPDRWENLDLGSFFAAWAAWLSDSDGFYARRNEPPIRTPSWKSVAEMLLAARVYE